MSESDPAKTAPAGWVIGVMLAAGGQPMQRHYYAVGHADRAKAEWTAVDYAVTAGEVAASPIGGDEPVAALRPLTRLRMTTLGLASGEVRELGWRYPRRWLT
ncbi:hypothetical protein LJR219_003008 [Phenylobacterium sp. LjRoot219]|uniref:hypothetical protein n=1 Tax=Phenylobacterium sp. LjRoot219 TaxID=3342283 RepID=UPI003ECF5F7E